MADETVTKLLDQARDAATAGGWEAVRRYAAEVLWIEPANSKAQEYVGRAIRMSERAQDSARYSGGSAGVSAGSVVVPVSFIAGRTLIAIAISVFTLGYMFPFGLALIRHKRNKAAIFFLNLFAGWTIIGWVVALVWAATTRD
jgi:hypothetical protein